MAARHYQVAHGLCGRLRLPKSAHRLSLSGKLRLARAHPSWNFGQTRAYAPAHAHAHTPRNTFKTETLIADGFPREILNKIVSENPETFHRLSADEYHDCLERFSDAIGQGANPWAVSFDDGEEVPAEVLHDLGCIMRHQTGVRGADIWSLVLWASASELGYVPSTLSLVRNLVASDSYNTIMQMHSVEARFQQLVSWGKDPDALTIEGQRLFKQGHLEPAMAMFQRALTSWSSDFELRWPCLLWQGKACLKLGRTEEAIEMLEPLAEYGYVEAEVELAKLLRTTDPERAQQYMYAAACKGSSEMFTFLSEMALEEALATQTTNKPGSQEGRRWAVEWSRLANWRADH